MGTQRVARPMSTQPRAAATGSPLLDAALDGGLAWGASVLLESEEGAGGPELALSVLRAAAARGAAARFVSAIRSPERVRAEIAALFPQEAALARVEAREARDENGLFAGIGSTPGDVLVVESASALARLAKDGDAAALHRRLAEAAADAGTVLVVVSALGVLPAVAEAALAEGSDVVMSFRWAESGATRRRLLRVRKVRGLAHVLDADQVPVYEIGLHRGRGVTVARVTGLV